MWNLDEIRVYGTFGFRKPTVFIRDPKIAKQLTVRDFDHFTDHRILIDEKNDPMFGKLLTSLKGQRWKGELENLSKLESFSDFLSQT
jgi:cytochrome P450 family 9